MDDDKSPSKTKELEAELAGILQAITYDYNDRRRPTPVQLATIRAIGNELNKIGGHQLMVATHKKVMEPHFEYYERLSGLVDRLWSGIGDWWA